MRAKCFRWCSFVISAIFPVIPDLLVSQVGDEEVGDEGVPGRDVAAKGSATAGGCLPGWHGLTHKDGGEAAVQCACEAFSRVVLVVTQVLYADIAHWPWFSRGVGLKALWCAAPRPSLTQCYPSYYTATTILCTATV